MGNGENVESVPAAGPLSMGAIYRRADLHARFGGSRFSGIVPSKREPVVLLFHTEEPGQQFYRDGFDDNGVYWYSAEGSSGDMTWTPSNRAVRDHAELGFELLFFERAQRKDGLWRFAQIFSYSSHKLEQRVDKTGKIRTAIVLGLLPVKTDVVPPVTNGLASSANGPRAATIRPVDPRRLTKFWRMSFRVGNHGHEMWPDCLKLGVAAITYYPLATTDLSQFPEGEPKTLWEELEPTQKASLRRVAYEMKPGDVIYVKQGPQIVDKGIVTGAYRFDSQFRLVDPSSTPWAHQVYVDWSKQFNPITLLFGAEQLTVKELTEAEVETLQTAESEVVSPGHQSTSPTHLETERGEPLIEDEYYRESPARLKVIVPLHNKLSNDFCRWLEKQHSIKAAQEQRRVDVRFTVKDSTILAELKICFGVGTTRSIREALGQLLEYNHYPLRNTADEWLVVLDDEPSESDRRYINILRESALCQSRLDGGIGPHFPAVSKNS